MMTHAMTCPRPFTSHQQPNAAREACRPPAIMGSHTDPQSLGDYMASYADIAHRSLANHLIDTDPATTTKGPITDPEERLAPTELAPWQDGAETLDALFRCLHEFDTTAEFPCRLHVNETGHELSTINSEAAVHLFDVDTIYKPAKRILDSTLKRPFLRGAIASLLHHQGYKIDAALMTNGDTQQGHSQVVFSPHSRTVSVPVLPRLGQKRKRSTSSVSSAAEENSEAGSSESQAEQNVEEAEAGADGAPSGPTSDPSPASSRVMPAAPPATMNIKSEPGDYYCSFLPTPSTSTAARLLMVGEAKAPHKLTRRLIQSALGSNVIIHTRQFIQQAGPAHADARLPDHLFARSVPTTDGGPIYHNQRWLAAVATQIYSTLFFKQLRYGYITTGESYILVRIRPGQPTAMDYLVLPALREPPAQRNGPAWVKWLATTPLARLSCLALLSLFTQGHLTDQEFRQARANARSMIWRTPRCREQSLDSSFVSSAPSGTKGSDSDWAESNGYYNRPTLPATLKRSRSDAEEDCASKRQRLSSPIDFNAHTRLPSQFTPPPEKQQDIATVPYCTARCINALVRRSTRDPSCPNWAVHQMNPTPPTASHFLELARSSVCLPHYIQNPQDHPQDEPSILSEPTTNAMYTRRFGATAAIFKVRVEPGGYVLVAKAARPTTDAVQTLKREERAYRRLRSLQGDAVPVCVGVVDCHREAAYGLGCFPASFYSSAGQAHRC